MEDTGSATRLSLSVETMEPLALDNGPDFPQLDSLVMIASEFLPVKASSDIDLPDLETELAPALNVHLEEPLIDLEPPPCPSLDEILTVNPGTASPTALGEQAQGISSFLQKLKFSTRSLSLFPKNSWKEEQVSFVDMCGSHFQCKSNRKVKFEHKLWNALQLTSARPDLYPVVGVMWVSDSVIQVNRLVFGRLLGLEKSTSALFNLQGSFPTHGFTELTINEMNGFGDLANPTPDFRDCRFFTRRDGKFSRFSKEADVMACTYKKPNFGV